MMALESVSMMYPSGDTHCAPPEAAHCSVPRLRGPSNEAMHSTAAVGRLRLPRASASDGQAVRPRARTVALKIAGVPVNPWNGPARMTRYRFVHPTSDLQRGHARPARPRVACLTPPRTRRDACSTRESSMSAFHNQAVSTTAAAGCKNAAMRVGAEIHPHHVFIIERRWP